MIATSRMKTPFSKILLHSGLLLGFLISALGLSAQLPTFNGKDKFTTEAEFALVTAVPKELCVGDVVTFTFKGKINTGGWHLYSSRTDGNIAYNPTMLEIFMDESKGIKLKGAMTENHKADEVDDKLMGGFIRSFHEKQVDFTQKLEITGPDVVLVGQFSSQTCTEEGMCKFLKLPIEWRIKAKACGTGAVVEPGVDSALTASNDTVSGVSAMPSFDFKPYDSTKTLSDNIKAQNRFFPDLSMVNGETGVCGFAHLEQARKYAEKVGRPLLLFFTSWTATSNRKMEKEVFQNPAVDSILRNRVVMVNLWADDETKETGGLLLKNGTPAKTLGDYVIDLQFNTFNTIAEPLFALQDPQGVSYGSSMGYNPDPVSFKSWLDSVITEYYKDKGIKEAAWLPKATACTPAGPGDEIADCSPSTLWSSFLIAFLAGLIAILTPCVFPMIPMTVSFFVKQGEGAENRSKGIRNGLIYAGSIIFIYGFVGFLISVIFGGKALYILGSHPIPNLIFFGIFFAFALSFLGMFEITLPSRWSTAANNKATAGGLLGPFFMALTLVIVSFSCTGPILGAALVQTTQGAECGWKPFAAMLGFGFAFGIPFGLMAMLPKLMEKLPMAGGWMNTVKVVFGFLELALCMKFLSNADQVMQWGLLDRQIFIGIWIVIFLFLTFYFLGWILLPHDEKKENIKVPRLIMSIAVMSFVVYLIPGLWGGPLPMMEGLIPPMNKEIGVKLLPHQFAEEGTINDQICKTERINAQIGIENEAHGFCMFYDLKQAVEFAKKVNKPLFVDFTGHTCANCRKMEQGVWPDDQVRNLLLNEFVMVSLYADDETKLDSTIIGLNGDKVRTIGSWVVDYQSHYFGTIAQPLYVLMDHDETAMVAPKGFDLTVKNYVDFLDSGIVEFNKRHNIVSDAPVAEAPAGH
jgi:thiol:disulfide interchange protein